MAANEINMILNRKKNQMRGDWLWLQVGCSYMCPEVDVSALSKTFDGQPSTMCTQEK